MHRETNLSDVCGVGALENKYEMEDVQKFLGT